jgi:trans-aconitate methyltransferase
MIRHGFGLCGAAATEYAHYCRHVTDLIRQHARYPATTLLDIGCGGGKNVLNLKRQCKVTGFDLSAAMLAQAKELNSECTFVLGDMRTFRLDRTFDAVLTDDAISYMSCLADFAEAFRTASAHLNPGGVLVVTPDVTVETQFVLSCHGRTFSRDRKRWCSSAIIDPQTTPIFHPAAPEPWRTARAP